MISGQRLQITLAVTGAVAWLLQGYDQAMMNALLSLPSFVATFPEINTSTDALAAKHSTLQGTAVALYEVGASVGALSCFFINDRWGRKKTTLTAAIIVLIGVILQASSYQLAQLIVARIVTGLGVGMFTAAVPSWVGESVDSEKRGRLIMLEGVAAIFGVMFVGWMELGFFFVPSGKYSSVSWRFPIAFQAIFPMIVIVGVLFLPESPRWLLMKDRHEEATRVMARLADEPDDSELVKARVEVIQHALVLEQRGHSNNPFAKTPNKHLNRTILAIVTNILAQMSGINVITFYSNIIFQHYLGYTAIESRVISSCLQTWQFVCTIIAVFLIDRFGRRKLLITAAFFMAIANAGLAGLESHLTAPGVPGASLFFYFIPLAAFPIGMFLIPFLYASEIAPLKIRSQITAMSASSNWIFNFLIAEVSPVAFSTIAWRYYLVFVCTNSLSVCVWYFFAPETRGRSLEDVDAIFLYSKNPLQAVKMARELPPGYAEEHDISEKAAIQAGHEEKI